MSREIKFRIWDSDQNRILPVIVMRYENGKQWFGFQRSEAGEVAKSMEYCQAYNGDPTVSIMQFTGLKDKNGREIYEGDIVRAASQGRHAICEVKWGHGAVRFFLHRARGGICWNLSGGGPDYSQETVEIIGNIHESPELLE